MFTLGRLPDEEKARRLVEETAARLHDLLAGERVGDGQAGRALGSHPNSIRYAAPTGTVLIRWDGARQPTIWTVPRPRMSPRNARLELARRYLKGWILARDEAALRAAVPAPAAARLLPGGDTYTLLYGADRELLVPDDEYRSRLWTSRVRPGAVLVEGDIIGTWRRAHEKMTIQTWRRLSRAEREAVEAEAASLPLPGVQGSIVARWEE